MAFGTGQVLTNAVRAILTNRIIGAGTEPKFCAMGYGATGAARTAAAADTALSTETGDTRSSTGGTRVTGSVANDTHQVTGTVTLAGATSRAIDEAAVFDAITTGNMYLSATFSVINLNQNDSIAFTWQLKFT